ncbi:unnamed protein product, partial [Discosporangium mesarthrocarpum]
ICIIGVAWSPKQTLVTKVMGSGADVLVAAPISPSLILDRIEALVHNRKPFVVTSDYVGPDRRFLDDRDSDIDLLDVPNSLQAKALGQYNAARIKIEIEMARAEINGQKIDRQAFQVSHLADKILEGFQEGDLTNAGQKLGELKKVTNDLKMRAFSAGEKDLEELCVPLRTVVQSLIDSRGKFSKKDLSLLAQLSMAVRAAVRPGMGGSVSARDITKMVVGTGTDG